MTETISAPVGSKAEKKSFYRMVFRLALPIALQNLINTALSSADVVMLNYVSQEALAAVSLATNISFILGSVYFGMSSGASVLISQYWGKRDYDTIERVMGIAFRISMTVALVFAVAATLFPAALMRLYTGDEKLIVEGTTYLRVVGVSFLFMGVSMMYLNMMRAMERVVLSTATYFISFITNVILNAFFIFVMHMGVLGVALATTIARFVEMAICIVDGRRSCGVRFRMKYLFEKNALLMKDFIRLALPSMGNEIIWGLGFSMYPGILGHLSPDGVAANPLGSVVRNLATVVGFGLANGAAIVIGKAIGENRGDTVKLYARRMLKVTGISALAAAVIIVLVRPLILSFASELTETAHGYLSTMLWINTYYSAGMILNTFLICGVFRAGGDAKYGFVADTIAMWCVFVPLGFLCGYVLRLPVMWVYFVICLDESCKFPVFFYHYLRRNWARNITRDFPAEVQSQQS